MAAVRKDIDVEPSTEGSIGSLFNTNGETRLDVQAGNQVVIRGARWARLAATDPHRVIAGGEHGVCEVLVDADGEPTAVHRLDGTERWEKFGEPSPGIGVLKPLYLPTRPQYEAKKQRVENASDTPRPGGLFAWNAKRVADERAKANETCDFCRDNPAVVRKRAWREDVLFGIGRSREEVVNRECWRCLDATPDADDVSAYRSPEDPGEIPVDFDEIEKDTNDGWDVLRPEEIPNQPDKTPSAVLWARDGRLDGLFSVYEQETDEEAGEYLLVAVLHHAGEPVGAETATLRSDSPDDVLSQARKIYASYWSTAEREIDWDSLKRLE